MLRHVAATFKDVAASWKILLSRPVFFPWLGGWQNCICTFNFERERDYPMPQRGSSQHPTGGSVTGNSHFDFSMLVFSADFPTDTKSRRKRSKTADAAEVIQSSGQR